MASDVDPVADLLVPELPGLLDDIDQAVIVHDASGRVQLLNAAARRLFPDLGLGDELRAEVLGRWVGGRLRPLADGWQAWVVSDTGCGDTGCGDTGRGAGGLDTRLQPVDQRDFMLEASRALAAGVGHDMAVAALVRLVVPVVGERAAVLLPAPRARVSWWRSAGGPATPAHGVTRVPAPRTAPVLAGALCGACADTTAVPPGELAELAAVFGPDITERSPVLAAPLRGPDRTEGLLIVVRPTAASLLAQLAALAGPTIGASRRRREQARALAQLQAPLLPPGPDALPELSGVQLGVAYRAAGELAVGGDFYLVRPTPDGGALLGLGDVCGKGAEALAESGRVQHSLAALMVIEQDPTRLLYLLNQALLAGGRTVFTTLVLGALRPADVGCRLTLATGGHPAPMVLRGGGRVEEVGVPGTVVGILPGARFGRTTITLAPGETCLLYSDGVTEAGRATPADQEQFGPSRLAACLRDCAGMTAQVMATRVERTVTAWQGRNDGDDIAVLAVRAV
ncbi:MAG: SpoIIE family protein phosphatase [Pseudonocardiales bacterium]|nr:SpoIIE family protein phosphatase [Pseudonocardiales bacterium]MBV9030086.1 SpoIIE family protein phosphatase [Pseudonocardiales bacterium]MBW0009910.1 SpoIIE family protein phosphatase [Pseudonocardiales bacterium]